MFYEPLKSAIGTKFVKFTSNGTEKYVLKEIPQDPKIRASIYDRIGSHPNIRTPIDTVPDRRIFVFRYLNENLLGFAERDLSLPLVKRILRDALRGLAALHERDLVHNGEEIRYQNTRTT
jgi:serine/threonine protein kinase